MSFAEICFVTTIRFVKTKISTSVQLFCDCGLLSVLCEAEMGCCASDLSLFRASIRVLTLRDNPQSQKSCNFGRISVFGLPNRPHAGDVGGASRAQRLCGRLWAAFAYFVSIAFACRICGRSCPHPIAAPAALRYHDKNCFKRALKCILRSKQAGKGTQHNKEG